MEALTKLMPVLTGGAQIASAGSNIYEGYKNQQYQDKLRTLAQDPKKMQAYSQGFVQPLNAGLEKGVANEAQAYAAERGLGTSPGPSQEILAQAIAPYVQQNQQQGYQNALQALGLGGGAQPSHPQAGLTQMFAGLKPATQPHAPTGGGGDPYAQLASVEEFAGQGGQVQPNPTPNLNYIDTQPLQEFAFPSIGG